MTAAARQLQWSLTRNATLYIHIDTANNEPLHGLQIAFAASFIEGCNMIL